MAPSKPRSLQRRLALWYALVMALVLAGFSASVYFIAAVADPGGPGHLPEPPDLSASRLLVALAMTLPIAIGVAVGGGFVITRRSLRPLDDVVAIAEQLGAERLDARIPVAAGTSEEVLRLVLALNAMLARLDQAVTGMRRFTADASHELRTPLALLMGEIELTLRRPRSEVEVRATLESTLDELGRLARLVESLLLLARSDNQELPLVRDRIDVGEVARQVLDTYDVVFAERQLRCVWRCDAPAFVTGDPIWLGRAIANLVDNACKFTPPGRDGDGEGEVAVIVASDAGRVTVTVRDTGPGLPPADRARVFERFYRATAVRGSVVGFGLGLALARDIVRQLGGDLVIVDDGPGATFRLHLPAA